MKRLVIILLVAGSMIGCNKKEDGASLAKEVCDCKAKLAKDEKGASKDFSASLKCSMLKVKVQKKLKDNAAELKIFQDRIGECGDWEYKKK